MRFLLYILLFATSSLFSQNFEKANELYRAEKYEAAIQEYEQILATGKESAEVYFNLGNAYYKLAKVGPSIYNYEKALLLNPSDSEIKNNLKFAQKMKIDEVDESASGGFSNIMLDFTSLLHYNAWACIVILFAFLFLAAFAIYYFRQASQVKRISFFAMFLMLIGFFVSTAAAFYQKDIFDKQQPAIIYDAMVEVKGEPNATANTAFELHEGTKVFILESLDDWRKISLVDGAEGWIMAKALRELK